MKRILYILIAVAVLASCSKHEDLDTLPEGGTHTPMTISVTDGGYASGDPKTRATENGYITQFTAGDQIGLYVVKPDGSYAQENVALTLTDNGSGTLAWQAPSGTTLYYEGVTAGLKYFAYYPYQTTLTGTLVPSASDAAGFFADVVTQWTPTTDQSTHAKYTAQDLMTGSSTVSKQADAYTLGLTMTHAMALVVIETPMTKYTFTNNSPAIPDYYVPAPDTRFYGFTPYSPSAGTYRLLVNPAQSGATDLTGSYTAADGSTKEYAIAHNDIAAANYHHYIVDKATVTQKNHTLQPGDFILKDGSLLGKDETLTEEQKAACVGIVYWVGDPTNSANGDPLLKRDKPGCTHGLVVALHEAKKPSTSAVGKMYWSLDYAKVNDWTNHADRGGNQVNITEENRYQGYANTVALKAYNGSSNVKDNVVLKVLPIAAIEQYQADYPAPVTSSGWYLPSVMELKYMCWGQGNSESTTGRDLLNTQFAKAGGTSLDASWNYWSSSERAGNSYGAWGVYFYGGGVYNSNKNSSEFWARVLFAF